MAHPVREPYLLEYGLRCLTPGPGINAMPIKQRQLHVIKHIEGIDQMKRLEDKAQLLVTEGGQPQVVHIRGIHAINLDRSACRQIQQPHDVQQCRLTTTRWAHDTQELTSFHRQIYILQRYRLHLVGPIDLLQFSQCNHNPYFLCISFAHCIANSMPLI